MSKSLYIADTGNNRIIERSVPALAYVDQMTGYWELAPVNLDSVSGIAANADYMFLYNTGILYKLNLADFSTVSYVDGNSLYGSPSSLGLYGSYVLYPENYTATFKLLSASDLSLVASVNNYTLGVFSWPAAACSDGTYVYVTDAGNSNVVKLLLADLSGVAVIGSFGSGNDEFSSPKGICTDGTHLYICDFDNNRIVKRLCSDLSYVSESSSSLAAPHSIATDNTYIYVVNSGTITPPTIHIIKLLCSTLEYVSDIIMDGPGNITLANSSLYVEDWAIVAVVKRDTTDDMNLVTSYLSIEGAILQPITSPTGVCSDGTYVYITIDDGVMV